MLELEGTNVLDLTQGVAGPYCTMLLADAGAHVTKAEPLDGDYARAMAPLVDNESAPFLALNRNKRSVAIDVEGGKGKTVLRRLAERADIIVHDMRPDLVKRIGVDYESLMDMKPDLVYCAISAFGEAGPLAGAPGEELVLQAFTGVWAGLGASDAEPVRVGADILGIDTGVMAFSGILGAFYHRLKTGQGQKVSCSGLATGMHLRSGSIMARTDPDGWDGFLVTFPLAPRDFGWQTKDKPVYFGLRRASQEDADRLLIELGLEDWAGDPRFENGAREVVGLGLHAAEARPIWEQGFKKRTSEEIIALVQRSGGEISRLNDYDDLFAHPQVDALGLVRHMEHPKLGRIKVLGSPWEFSSIEEPPLNPPPQLGQHTDAVLLELGYTPRDIQTLRDDGAVK